MLYWIKQKINLNLNGLKMEKKKKNSNYMVIFR